MDLLMQSAIALCGFGAALGLTLGLVRLTTEGGSKLVESREAQDQRALEELFIRGVTPRQVTAMTAGGAIVVGVILLMMTGNLVFAAATAAGIWFLPRAVFAYLRVKRLERIDEQLPEALSVLANSTRAGLSLTQAIEHVATRGAPPVSEEMAMIIQETRLGSDLGKSIDDARHRMGSRSFNLVATALQVNRDKGGNLPEALETMAASLKEIWRLEQRLITASAEARKSVWVISGMPLLIFVMVSIFEPSIPAALVGSLLGIAMLFVASLMYGTALWWLLRILRRDV